MARWIAFASLVLAAASCGGDDKGGGPLGDVLGDLTGLDLPGEVAKPDLPHPDLPGDVRPDAPKDLPKETASDADPDACVPKCGGKKCGPDGCGGECGQCTGAAKFCHSDGKCHATCQMPSKWGPSSVVLGMQIPAKPADVANLCYDYTGEGQGMNALALLAPFANDELAKAFTDATYFLLFDFAGITEFVLTDPFVLAGLAAVADPANAGQYRLIPSSYEVLTCQPQIAFAGAKIGAGQLFAGPPADFTPSFPLTDMPLSFTIAEARLHGLVTGSADGVALDDGTLTGVLPRAEVEAALEFAKGWCEKAADPKPAWCDSLGLVESFLPVLFDLKDGVDGTWDACDDACQDADEGTGASVCLTFTSGPAKISGFRPTPAGG
ncbi:MAG: hypothetical protein FJ087_17425 [Deltaproteobacteria bacterium]|nr:hypothetical protein [Deltaproteobacteria bacterium]